jgi:hypothetical protein
VLKFLGFMWNPLSWVMEAAAIMAIALAHSGRDLRGKVFIHPIHSFHRYRQFTIPLSPLYILSNYLYLSSCRK